MELDVPPERAPIRTNADTVIRVGGTRVTLDTVVAAFEASATAQEIVQQYPSVTLADIYSVIAYYLRHQSEVRAYLAQRHQQAAQIREENERRFDPTGGREDCGNGNASIILHCDSCVRPRWAVTCGRA